MPVERKIRQCSLSLGDDHSFRGEDHARRGCLGVEYRAELSELSAHFFDRIHHGVVRKRYCERPLDSTAPPFPPHTPAPEEPIRVPLQDLWEAQQPQAVGTRRAIHDDGFPLPAQRKRSKAGQHDQLVQTRNDDELVQPQPVNLDHPQHALQVVGYRRPRLLEFVPGIDLQSVQIAGDRNRIRSDRPPQYVRQGMGCVRRDEESSGTAIGGIDGRRRRERCFANATLSCHQDRPRRRRRWCCHSGQPIKQPLGRAAR